MSHFLSFKKFRTSNLFFQRTYTLTVSRKYFYGHAFTTQMGCQAVSDSRESKIIEKYKQKSFELSQNIDKYKNSLPVLYN